MYSICNIQLKDVSFYYSTTTATRQPSYPKPSYNKIRKNYYLADIQRSIVVLRVDIKVIIILTICRFTIRNEIIILHGYLKNIKFLLCKYTVCTTIITEMTQKMQCHLVITLTQQNSYLKCKDRKELTRDTGLASS